MCCFLVWCVHGGWTTFFPGHYVESLKLKPWNSAAQSVCSQNKLTNSKMSLSKLSVGLASDPVGRLMHWCIFNFCQENVCCCCCAFVLCTFEVFHLSTCCFSGILLVLFLQLITKDKQDEPCWETTYSWISHAKLMGGFGLKHAKLSLFNWKEKGFESQKYLIIKNSTCWKQLCSTVLPLHWLPCVLCAFVS